MSLFATHENPTASVTPTGWYFSLPGGDDVTLSRGFVTLSSISLVACPSATGRFFRSLLPIGHAYAHGLAGPPTTYGVPHVLALPTAPGTVAALGEFEPPAGEYCEVRVTLAPADSDAEGLPPAPDLVGETLHFDGTFRAVGQSPVDFLVRNSGVREVRRTLSPPLLLSRNQPRAAITVGLHPEATLVGVTVAATNAGAETLANLGDSLTVTAEPKSEP
ncbi:MAG: hypothetical protein ACKVPX_14370 [Myxococcaceae bacterium]